MSSVDEKIKQLGEVLARLRDGLQGLQPAIEAIDAFLNYLGKPLDPEHPEIYDPEKISWDKTQGAKGPFEKTDDVNNAEYKALRKDLAEHNGKLTHGGLFYWVFENGVTIGRKKAQYDKQRQPTETAKPASVAAPRDIFPKELADMLTFEESGEWIIIKPRQFLGSENFAKIAAIVRDAGGEYVSVGKESHFRIPRKTS